MINVLLIGDIVGSPGRAIVKQALPKILRKRAIDYCIANAENLAGGNGVTRELAEELLSLGVNCLTSGNHIWDKREIMPIMDMFPQLLRPANYPAGQPGKGHHIGKSRTGLKVATLNLSGRVFMNGAIDDPFAIGKRIAEELRKEILRREKQRIDEKELRRTMESFDEVWKAMNLEEQRALLRQLVEKVGYDGRTGKVTVSFKSAGVKELVQKGAVR